MQPVAAESPSTVANAHNPTAPTIIGGREVTQDELINHYNGLPVQIQYFLNAEQQRIYAGSTALAAKLVVDQQTGTEQVKVLLGTAGHLFQKGDSGIPVWEFSACVGHSNLQDCNETDGKRVGLDEALQHAGFSEQSGEPHNDMAMAVISLRPEVFSEVFGTVDPAALRAGVQLASLPGDSVTMPDGSIQILSTEIPSGTVAEVIGGGRTVADIPSVNGPIKVVTQTAFSDEFMTQLYPEDFDPSTMIGIGDSTGKTDTCNGDSGAGFMLPIAPNLWEVLAFVSWGAHGCAVPGDVAVNSKAANDFYSEGRNFFMQTGQLPQYKLNMPIAMRQ